MYMTEFKLEEDGTYWEAFASQENDSPFVIKVRVIYTMTGYLVVIRDYKTGFLLDEEKYTPYFLPTTAMLSATRFAKRYLSIKRSQNMGKRKEVDKEKSIDNLVNYAQRLDL